MGRWNGRALVALVGVLSVAGCDRKDDASASASANSQSESAEGVEKTIEDAADDVGMKKFVKGMSKKACEVLTPEKVANAYQVPEDELKQMKIMGCIYSWKEKKDGETVTTLEANLTLMRAHETVDGAKTWFKNATENKTGEELKEEMAQVTKKAKEHKTVDTKTKKETMGTLGALITEGTKDGTTYEPIQGIGDEAKVAKRDGAIWVRVGNLTFTANAYKGPPQPKPELDLKNLDVKKMTQQSMEAQAKWLEKTHEERKKASIQLAKLVLDGLS